MQLNSTVLKNITVLYVPYGEPLRAAAPLHNGFHCGIHAPAGYIDAQVIVCRRPPGLVALEAIVGRPGPVHSLQLFLCFGSGHAVPAADRLDAVTIAKMGQYAENVYFGKPCGLMDQMASSVGNIVTIDFMDPAVPVVRKIQCDFSGFGHALCIIDTGSSHDDLTDDYADITREMRSVAAYFGQQVLRDVPEPAFCKAIPALRETCGDRATLRALHFFADNRRAVAEAEALDRGDFVEFLRLVNESGISSATDLQNTWSVSNPKQQAIPVALAVGRQLLEGSGAIRVHGGGFAGTIQAFVPEERLAAFKKGMEELVGKDKCYVLCIRPMGGCVVTE